jgi:intracellular multiplication protein IcmO
LTRGPTLPIRLPRSAGCLDRSSPTPGTRKPRRADGTFFIGWSINGQEVWATAEDTRWHIAIPGTTGAGKTTAILSLLSNAVAQGSGFVLVDGKADRDLFGKVMALARRFGREDDVRVLNFMVASGVKDSDRFNPFAIGNADAIHELLASQLGDQTQNDPNGVFRDRAVALIRTITPVLVWLRDHKGISLNIEVIRFSMELRWIWKLAMERKALLRDPDTGAETELDISGEIPENITWPLRSYLGELPGYDPSLPLEKQKGGEPSKQHGYAQFYFTAMFAHMAVSLGHIFRVENGEIDMRDIVLNRRILVVNLPALETSDASLAALGKLVVASLRGMMAQLLGASLEGEYTEADKPGMGPAPYTVVLDELAYYATSGLDRMLAMGRGLNISFMLGFKEVSGIWARLGEKTASLLGNTSLTIAMRQQDALRTREWIQKTAGETYVTQATSYRGAADGAYREARHAELRPVSRVDWHDLTNLLEGEAIILFGGRRVYGRVFRAKYDDRGPKRIGWSVLLREPDPEQVRDHLARVDRMVSAIESGSLTLGQEEPRTPVLDALVRGFIASARTGRDGVECARAALEAIDRVPEQHLTPRPPPPEDGTPVTSVTPMLTVAAEAHHAPREPSGPPQEPVNARLLRCLHDLELAAGATPIQARDTALSVIAERDEVLSVQEKIEPPAMSADDFRARLNELLLLLGTLRASGVPRAA